MEEKHAADNNRNIAEKQHRTKWLNCAQNMHRLIKIII